MIYEISDIALCLHGGRTTGVIRADLDYLYETAVMERILDSQNCWLYYTTNGGCLFIQAFSFCEIVNSLTRFGAKRMDFFFVKCFFKYPSNSHFNKSQGRARLTSVKKWKVFTPFNCHGLLRCCCCCCTNRETRKFHRYELSLFNVQVKRRFIVCDLLENLGAYLKLNFHFTNLYSVSFYHNDWIMIWKKEKKFYFTCSIFNLHS